MEWYIAHLLCAHTQGCAWETAKTFSHRLWMRVKREWKFRDSSRHAVAPQARSPHWHAPMTGMQPGSELSALASSSWTETSVTAGCPKRSLPLGLVSESLEREQRRSSVWGGCFEPGRFYWHARCLGFGTGFLNPGRASRHPRCPSQGAPEALLLLGSGAQQPALHVRRKCNRWWARSCERQGKTCQGVSSWSDSFSFMVPEPGQSPLWHCASFLVYV